jgi:hypothetical protein
MSELPPRIDLIEILHATGEMTMAAVITQVGAAAAWPALAALVHDRIAAIWLIEPAGPRPLADWETAALLRSRLQHSAEPTPPDDHLLIRAGERINPAYHDEFGEYYYRSESDGGR